MTKSRQNRSFRKKTELFSGSFEPGYDRHTEGILIQKEPISVKTNGEERLIFFIDTQGVFDNQTDPAVSGWIAGLSMLISDVQIINLRSNIGADDLSEIRRFAEFAAAFPQHELAKSLLFVLRDTPKYGLNGREFIENVWKRCSMSPELSEITQMIGNRFPYIGCVVAPSPSEALKTASSVFRLTEQDRPLVKAFEELHQEILDRISRNDRKSPVLIEYCRQAAHFLEHEAPRVTISVQVMTEARMTRNVRVELDSYESELKNAQALKNLEEIHEEAKRRGLRRLEAQEATPENIELMKEKFLDGIEPIRREIAERFRLNDEQRLEEVELRRSFDEGKASIQRLTTLDQVFDFVENGKLGVLLRGLVEKSPLSGTKRFEETLKKDLEELLHTHSAHKVPVHFDDLEYRLNNELREGIENGHYTEIPTIDHFRRFHDSKMDVLCREIERIQTVTPLSANVIEAVQKRAENRFQQTVHDTFSILVETLEKRQQLDEQRRINDQRIRQLQEEEAVRQQELLQLQRQQQLEEEERQRKSVHRENAELIDFSQDRRKQMEVEEKERRKAREQQKSEVELLMRKNLEIEEKLREEKERMERQMVQRRAQHQLEYERRRAVEQKQRTRRERDDKQWDEERLKTGNKIQEQYEKRAQEENRFLEQHQRGQQLTEAEHRKNAADRRHEMETVRKEQTREEEAIRRNLRAREEELERQRATEESLRAQALAEERAREHARMERVAAEELRQQERERREREQMVREQEKAQARRTQQAEEARALAATRPSPSTQANQRIQQGISRFEEMVKETIEKYKVSRQPLTDDVLDMLKNELKYLLDGEVQVLASMFGSEFNSEHKSEMETSMRGQFNYATDRSFDECFDGDAGHNKKKRGLFQTLNEWLSGKGSKQKDNEQRPKH